MKLLRYFLFLAGIFYVSISIFQISAVADALKFILMIENTFLEGILFIVSLFITFTPLLGPILGIIGATVVWKWNLIFSLLLFFWPYLFGGIVWQIFKSKRQIQPEEKASDAEEAEILEEWKK